MAAAAGLVVAIGLSAPSELWLPFLGGALAASCVALASAAANARRQSGELARLRARLQAEAGRRERAEQAAVAAGLSHHFVDELLPGMLVYLGPDRRVRFHNRAYAEWLVGRDTRLEGRDPGELLGQTWTIVGPHLEEAFKGAVVRYERTQRSRDGHPVRIAALYLPTFGSCGEVSGVFALMTDVTGRQDRIGDSAPAAELPADARSAAADRLARAIARDELALYFQDVVPADPGSTHAAFCELFVRLKAEEESRVPPGAFLEDVARHGLLPDIELWEVRRLLDWAAAAPRPPGVLYSLRLSAQGIADPRVRDCVREHRARDAAGPALCFELGTADAAANVEATRELMAHLRPLGCSFAFGGCGCHDGCEAIVRALRPEYLLIETGVVAGARSRPGGIERIERIARLARAIGACTVAEGVDSEEMRAVLASAGVDFVQGPRIAPLRMMQPAD